MSRTIVFSSPMELARFLWGDPGTESGKAPAYQVLMDARNAWHRQNEPGGVERLRMALQALVQYTRAQYFYPPHDPVLVPGTPRALIALGYRSGFHDTSIYWSLTTLDVLSNEQTLSTLRTTVDQGYGLGFFKKHIVSARRVSDEELVPSESRSFPVAEVGELKQPDLPPDVL